MLFLTFQIGHDRYALDTRDVVEVLPLIDSKAIPRTGAGVAGVFNYHGKAVPLIDLTEMALGRESEARMSTRVILVRYARPSVHALLLGLKAERVTETIERIEADFVESGVKAPGSPYLGPVTLEGSQIIQRIEIRQMMTEEVLAQLSSDLAKGD